MEAAGVSTAPPVPDEEVEELKPERRRDDWGYQSEEELEPEGSAWEPLDPPEFPKPKKSKGLAKPKGSKKAKTTPKTRLGEIATELTEKTGIAAHIVPGDQIYTPPPAT